MTQLQSGFRESEVVVINDGEGQPTLWVKISARLKAFLAQYPIGEYGIRVFPAPSQSGHMDTFVKLYELCIVHGRKPSDFGLDPARIGECRIVIQLLDRNQNVLMEESALGRIEDFKSYEQIATAAVGRLLSLSGFPGNESAYDQAEARDIKQATGNAARSLRTAQQVPDETPRAATVDEVETTLTEDAPPDVVATSNPAYQPPAETPDWTVAERSQPVVRQPDRFEQVKAQVVRGHRARNLPVPEMQDLEAAQRALRALSGSRVNGAGTHGR